MTIEFGWREKHEAQGKNDSSAGKHPWEIDVGEHHGWCPKCGEEPKIVFAAKQGTLWCLATCDKCKSYWDADRGSYLYSPPGTWDEWEEKWKTIAQLEKVEPYFYPNARRWNAGTVYVYEYMLKGFKLDRHDMHTFTLDEASRRSIDHLHDLVFAVEKTRAEQGYCGMYRLGCCSWPDGEIVIMEKTDGNGFMASVQPLRFKNSGWRAAVVRMYGLREIQHHTTDSDIPF